jgi:hypothetical protein
VTHPVKNKTMRITKINLHEKLYNIPVGRWSTLRTERGVADVYRCDSEDNDTYIIEAHGHPRVRLSTKKALHVLKDLVGDEF